MTKSSELKDPWLVAAWPGIGNVAAGAAAYLVDELKASLVRELPAHEFFDADHVEVEHGVARPTTLPRSMFFEWTSEHANHELLIFLGEAQPLSAGYALCRRVIEYATERGVTRVFTFAAMATQLHPSARPRVFGAATDKQMLPVLREFEVEVLENGQIGGLNGLLLAAAAERGLPGACLLGELPFFAAGVQNPTASLAVLEVFSKLAGIAIDFRRIREAGREVDTALLELLEKMKEAARQQREGQKESEGMSMPESAAEHSEIEHDPAVRDAMVKLDELDRARLEQLFEKARGDRTTAFQLKEELDRLDVFDQYEDRFLDLFKRAE